MDFMSDSLYSGRRFRTVNIIDDFNRESLAIEIESSLPTTRVIRVLERIAAYQGYPSKYAKIMALSLLHIPLNYGQKNMGLSCN